VAGRDITEGDDNVWALAEDGLPIARGVMDVGVATSTVTWQNTDVSYDVAVGGQPFIYAINDARPYIRQTAPFRKEQFDNQAEPGEQSLTGWWIRSQSSFHAGAGIKFYDPSAGETVQNRFVESKGLNIWTKGQVTLLKACAEGHNTTAPIGANGSVQQHLRSIKWGSNKGVLLHDGYDVDKILADDPDNPIHFIDYNDGTDAPVYSICDDGVTAYWITNSATKKEVYKKALTGVAGAGDVLMFDEIGTISNAAIEYVKDRIILCADNKVYEFAGSATAMPTPVYTHATATHVYTSITASGPAIYIAGYNGIQSTIQKFTLTTAGAMPTLTSAIVAAELPVGEIVHKIHYYLGYMMIGTNKGIRVASVSDQDGSLSYGPLIVETTQPCYDFATRDHYVWCATSVAGEPGVIRIDIGVEIEQLRFAYTNDIYYAGITGHQTTACAFIGNDDPNVVDRLTFCTTNNGTTDGAIYVESASELITNGFISTGNIRYGTLEPKNFKRLLGRGNFDFGSMTLYTIKNDGSLYDHISYDASIGAPEVNTLEPEGQQEYLAYRFELFRDADDNTKGPVFTGYQAKATIATPRQRVMQFPVYCFDIETDRYNSLVGYEGRAIDRLRRLEDIEANGDIANWQDLTTGENRQVVIEQISFTRMTPPDKRFDGFGGVIQMTVRTV
jgi:hypothetical protein